MTTSTPLRPATGRPAAGVLTALATAAETADELLLGTVRDVHGAVARRVYGTAATGTAGSARLSQQVHDGVSWAVCGSLGAGLRATGRGLRQMDRRGVGPRIEDSPRGRFLVSAVNGLIGDK